MLSSLSELSGNCILLFTPSECSSGAIFGCPQGCFISTCGERLLYFLFHFVFYRTNLIFTLRTFQNPVIFSFLTSLKLIFSHWSPIAKILSHISALFFFFTPYKSLLMSFSCFSLFGVNSWCCSYSFITLPFNQNHSRKFYIKICLK